MNKKALLIPVLFVLVAGIALSAGFGPGRKVYNFEPNREYEGKIYVELEEPSRIVLTKEGDAGKYILLDKEEFAANSTYLSITYIVKMPEMLNRSLSGGIRIRYYPEKEKQEMINMQIDMLHQVEINYTGAPVAAKEPEKTDLNRPAAKPDSGLLAKILIGIIAALMALEAILRIKKK